MDERLAHARTLAAAGDDDAAKLAYVEVLRGDPANLDALNELGNLAFSGGSAAQPAARTARPSGITRAAHWCA